MLALPITKVRDWLSGRGRDARFSDIESSAVADAQIKGPATAFGRIDPPRADDDWGVSNDVGVADIRPGDVLVVPSASGGCDRFGWAPAASDAVDDLGDLNVRRPRVLLGPHESVLGSLPQAFKAVIDDLLADTTNPREAYAQLAPGLVERLRRLDRHQRTARSCAAVLESRAGEAVLLPEDNPDSLVLTPRASRGSTTFSKQSYGEHVKRVEELTVTYARSQNVDDDLVQTLRLAARYHDVGKLDNRFQAWLNRGVRPPPDERLAHSGYSPRSRASKAFRITAGWPQGKRHEMISAVLAARALRAGAFDSCEVAFDSDLLLYLPPIHHGQMRPFLPMFRRDGRLRDAEDPDSSPVTVTAKIEGTTVSAPSDEEIGFLDHADRFLQLNDRYGPWGLAALEATLVLADRVASAKPV